MMAAYAQVWDRFTSAPNDKLILRNEDSAIIPFDELNIDYLDYLDWIAEGNDPDPCTPPEKVNPHG